MTRSPADESLLVDLILRATEARERGEPVDPESLCRERPEFLADVRAALAVHERVAGALAGSDVPAAGLDPRCGRVLGGRYELIRRIGMGAMGSVFAALDQRLKRHVAVKVVEPWVLQEPDRRARFRREAQAVAALRHSGIVAVHDHGEGELPFLVMDLVPGIDLEVVLDPRDREPDRVRSELLLEAFAAAAAQEARAAPRLFAPAELAADPAAWRQPWPALAARIALGIAHALAHAHGHGVLHRDVKPSNVRLRPDGSVVLLDFGLARLPAEGSLTRAGTMLGTLAYMAPEQVRGERVSERSDVYGLGATLYRLLTLATPFTGEPEALMKRILWDEPIPVRRRAPEMPRDLAAICHKAIEKRPDDRYQSAAALAADLEAFLEFRPVVAAPPSTVTRVWRKLRRRPALAAAAVLLAVGLPFAAWAGQHAVHAAAAVRRAANLARAGVPALVTLEGFNPAYRVAGMARSGPDDGGRALDRLGQVLAADPHDVEALAMRAMLHLDCGRGAQGLADLRQLAADQPGSALLREVVQRLSTGTPWTDEAWRTQLLAELPAPTGAFDLFLRGYLQLRAVRYPKGVEDLEQAIGLEPGSGAALHLLPLALLGAGEPARAMAAALEAEGALGNPTARTRYVLGYESQLRGRYAEAAQMCEQSLQLCPDQPGALNNLANCLQSLGRFEAALQRVDQALAVRSDSVPSWRTKLRILRDLEQWDDIAAITTRFHTAGGGPWWLDLELGVIQLRRAIQGLRRATEDEEQVRRCGEAKELLSAALAGMDPATLSRDSNQTKILLRVAERLEQGDTSGAAGQLLEAVGSDPPEPRTLSDAAQLRLRAGNDDGTGLFLLAQAHRLAPEDPDIGARLIHFLVERKSLTRAAGVWRTCFGPRPHSRAEDAKQEILKAAVRVHGREALPRFRTLLGETEPAASRAANTSTETKPTTPDRAR